MNCIDTSVGLELLARERERERKRIARGLITLIRVRIILRLALRHRLFFHVDLHGLELLLLLFLEGIVNVHRVGEATLRANPFLRRFFRLGHGHRPDLEGECGERSGKGQPYLTVRDIGLRHAVLDVGRGFELLGHRIVGGHGQFTFEDMRLVSTLISFGQLIDSPDNRTKGLFVLGHTRGGGHHRQERISSVQHEAIETLEEQCSETAISLPEAVTLILPALRRTLWMAP